MSGTATATAALVKAVQGTKAKILETRKTVPGLRLIDKWAVLIGRRGALSSLTACTHPSPRLCLVTLHVAYLDYLVCNIRVCPCGHGAVLAM